MDVRRGTLLPTYPRTWGWEGLIYNVSALMLFKEGLFSQSKT